MESETMKRLIVTVIAATMVAGFGVSVQPQRALADTTTCSGFLTGTINGGVSVPTGDTCFLAGATVHGGVSVTGGTLFTFSDTIDGGLSFDGAAATSFVCDTNINGGALVENVGVGDVVTIGEVDTADCPGGRIDGGARYLNNPGVVELDHNSVHGTVTFTNNTGFLQEIESNDINGSLDCTGNGNIIDDGLPNTTTGQKLAQCASL
jgi:hypothetical protein